MDRIKELRAKRTKAWEAAKAFLDSKSKGGSILSAEDTAAYEKMEDEVVTLGREINRLERQRAIDAEFNKPTRNILYTYPRPGRVSSEYAKAFWNMMRGEVDYDVQNALSIGTDSEGGYLVPDEFERIIVQALETENVFRRIAHVITTLSGDRKIPMVAAHGTATWTDEGEPIAESDEVFGQISIGIHKLGTIMRVSEELLSDSAFNIPAYIAGEFARRIGKAEEAAFVSGDGVGKPSGVLAAIDGAQLGATAASKTTITYDEVLDLYYSLKTPYRAKAVFLANDSTLKVLRKLKDGNGQYLWQPSLTAEQPDTILGRPVESSEFVPGISPGAKVMLFGDFNYYWIADRQVRNFQRLNELYAVTGQVGFKAYERVDGKLILPEAIKVLQMKA